MSIILYSSHLIASSLFWVLLPTLKDHYELLHITHSMHTYHSGMCYLRALLLYVHIWWVIIFGIQFKPAKILWEILWVNYIVILPHWVNFKLFMVYLGILYVKGFMKWYLVYVKVRGLMLNHVKRSIFRML